MAARQQTWLAGAGCEKVVTVLKRQAVVSQSRPRLGLPENACRTLALVIRACLCESADRVQITILSKQVLASLQPTLLSGLVNRLIDHNPWHGKHRQSFGETSA